MPSPHSAERSSGRRHLLVHHIIRRWLASPRLLTLDTRGRIGTGDPCGERAARDVLVVKFDHDVVIPTGRREVGHRARPVFIVLTGDLSFGRTLDSERQPPCRTGDRPESAPLQGGSPVLN